MKRFIETTALQIRERLKDADSRWLLEQANSRRISLMNDKLKYMLTFVVSENKEYEYRVDNVYLSKSVMGGEINAVENFANELEMNNRKDGYEFVLMLPVFKLDKATKYLFVSVREK